MPTPDLLARIEQINWSEVECSYFPQWIKDWLSNDKNARIKAYNCISAMASAGSESPEDYGPLKAVLRTEAPILAVPFLIEMLKDEKVVDKYFLLEILWDFAYNIHLHIFRYPDIKFPWMRHDIDEVPEPCRSRAYRL